MRARTLRAPLLALAIAIAAAYVVYPRMLARAAGEQSQQSQRRGKNGKPDSSASSPGSQNSSASSSDSQPGPDASSTPAPSGQGAPAPASHTEAQPSAAQPASQDGPQQSAKSNPPNGADSAGQDSQNTQSGQSRVSPPPFDRPPVWARQRSQTTNRSESRAPDSGASGRYDSQTQPSSGADQNQGGYANPGYGRDSSGPPVLARSPGLPPERGGSNNGSSRSGPPVLQRGGEDDSGSGNESPAPPVSSRGDDQSRNTQQNGDETIKLDATLVNIPVIVSDRSGRYIPQLRKNDFAVWEDGVRQQVAFFGSEEVPFNVALLLDVSPSVSNSQRDIQDAALAFVDELRPDDKVMIVAFDEHVRFLTDFTNDRQALSYAIQSTRIGNGTSVYQAVYDTVADRLRYVQGRKAMILFSDGEDTTSRRVRYEDAINIVAESDVLVYGLRYPDTGGYGPNIGFPRTRMPFPIPGTRIPFPIPLPFPWPGGGRGPWGHFDSGNSTTSYWAGQWGRRGQRGYGRDFMRDVTEAGGGPVYDARTVGDMSRLARQIADELRHVYVVSYYPTNPLSNGGYRTLRVSIVGHDDLSVRHRRGYYADAVNGKPTT